MERQSGYLGNDEASLRSRYVITKLKRKTVGPSSPSLNFVLKDLENIQDLYP